MRRSAALSDGELFDLVKQRLDAGVSSGFGQIAWAAHQSNRKELASRFLAMERRVEDRVPLYLMMEQERTALKEASEAHDADLMLFASIQLYLRCVLRSSSRNRWKNGSIPSDLFASLIAGFPEIGDELQRYLDIRGENVETLLRGEGRWVSLARTEGQDRFAVRTPPPQRVSGLRLRPAVELPEADPVGAVRGSVGAKRPRILE